VHRKPTSLPRVRQRREILGVRQKLNCRVYTGDVRKPATLCSLVAALFFCPPACSQYRTASDPAVLQPAVLQPGVVTAHVPCAAAPDQSYALYLPSQYSAEKRWPIVYVFDPLARGSVAVERMKDAAERYGFIVVGSNNSRNGPWKVEIDAAQAMSDDTHVRFSIDDRRVYFAGFSGGSRVASHIAQVCKCAAGVMLNGAGFPVGRPPTREAPFAVFAAVGDLDFNYAEVTRLDQTLGQLGFLHALRYFEGPHQWAPGAVMEEAFAWFRIVAMKESREPRDASFIATQRDAATARAQDFEHSGDLYAALREYREAAAAFDGLADTAPFQHEVTLLARQKAVRDAEKRQRQELEQQDAFTRDISAGLNSLRLGPADRAGLQSRIERRIVELRSQAEKERRPDKTRVLQRAVADVFAQALESGLERLAEKDASIAKDYFELALAANPNSGWALNNLATACALAGDRKGALDTLLRAKQKAPDAAAFSSWLEQEAAFAFLRSDPKFRALLSNPASLVNH
jgi:tetratricopeptide (TPR) repeat protein